MEFSTNSRGGKKVGREKKHSFPLMHLRQGWVPMSGRVVLAHPNQNLVPRLKPFSQGVQRQLGQARLLGELEETLDQSGRNK